MLVRQGIITTEEADLLVNGLMEILEERSKKGDLTPLRGRKRDIHSFYWRHARWKKVGDVAKNCTPPEAGMTSVATDFRLYLKGEISDLNLLLMQLISALVERAGKTKEIIMPGYTHLQRA